MMKTARLNQQCLYPASFSRISRAVFSTLLLGAALFWANTSHAITAQDIVVSTPVNQGIAIDVTNSVSAPGTVTITQPQNGSAGNSGSVINYTPNTNFEGIDRLSYTIVDSSDGSTATAQITINVGSASNTNLGPTADVVVGSLVNQICADAGNNNSDLTNRCNELNAATDEERANANRALAPEEVSIQSNVDRTLGSQQQNNISARLAAVRRGERISAKGLNVAAGAREPLPNYAWSEDERSGGAAAGEVTRAGGRLGAFISGNLGTGDRDDTARESGYDYDTYGITAGVDYRFTDKLVLGMALGYADTELTVNQAGGGLDVDGISISFYGSYYPTDKIYIDGSLTYAGQNHASRRNINYTAGGATVNRTARGDADSTVTGASVGAGYELATSGGLTTTVLGSLNYLNSKIDAYRESGASELNLAIDEREFDSLRASLGVQFTYAVSLSKAVVIPQLNLAWQYEFEDDVLQVSGSFISDPSARQFSFAADTVDTDYGLVGLGVSAVFANGISGFVEYDAYVGREHHTDHNVSLGARFELDF